MENKLLYIAFHSWLYYCKDYNILTDSKFDEINSSLKPEDFTDTKLGNAFKEHWSPASTFMLAGAIEDELHQTKGLFEDVYKNYRENKKSVNEHWKFLIESEYKER